MAINQGNTVTTSTDTFNSSSRSENIDPHEVEKFEALASRWWDRNSEFKPLHEINPIRMGFIEKQLNLAEKTVLDVGCGGGILSEAMAHRGAKVTGIDMGKAPLEVAKLHLLESGVSVDYQQTTAESFALKHPQQFEVITCLEMLEHVPDPASIIQACYELLQPGGHLFVSTINRNPKAYAFAILGAEYILNMLPRGTHDYKKFIRPSELAQIARNSNFSLIEASGMTYNLINKKYKLDSDLDVNYLMYFRKPK